MSSILPFQFETAEVRVIRDEQGEPWFVAKDVAEVLGYAKPRNAIATHCKGASIQGLPSNGGVQEMTIIPERDVYRLIMRSKLPSAERFEDWVVGEVLPSVRKHGGYMTPEKVEEALLNPDTIIRLATDLKAEREQRQRIQAERDRLKPKADTMDALMATDTALPIGSVAKALHKDFGIGRNRLFRFLRNRGLLMANNEPKQEYLNRGYFRVVERRFEVNGEMRVGTQTLVYQKGVNYIARLLREGTDAAA